MLARKILLTFFVVGVTIIALTSGSPLAEESGVNPEVYGTWDLLEIENMGMMLQSTLTIDKNQIINHNTCMFREYSVVAQTSSPAVITPNEIRVLESSMAVEDYSPGFLRCKASIEAATMQYQLRNGKLFLYMPEDEETFELTRSGGQFRAAKRYKKSKDSRPELAHTNQGTTYSKKGKYKEAIKEYDKAIEINPGYALAYYNRSVAYTKTKQYDKAINDCNKVLQLDPKHASSYYTRGVSYWHLGSKNQAVKDLQTAAKLKHKGAQNYLTSMGVNW
jgi:tetratricopeptide (TPR) repeat protein